MLSLVSCTLAPFVPVRCELFANKNRFVGWLEFGFYFVPGNNEVSWRFPIALQAIFPIAVLCMMPFLVESPRWLLAKDRLAEGRKVLARLENQAEDSELVNTRMQAILNSIYIERQGHTRNPFAKTPNRYLNRTLLALGVNVSIRALYQSEGANRIIDAGSNVRSQRDHVLQ